MTLDAGIETYYRLGQKIEHYIKKFDTVVPKEFSKWAVICEHIIRHYNEGWANGYELDIRLWKIWNGPDLDPDNHPAKRCWGGTTAQFYDLFEITAKHLKKCFPQLMIGGPASAGREAWCGAVIWLCLNGIFFALLLYAVMINYVLLYHFKFARRLHECKEKLFKRSKKLCDYNCR